jgi:hypothetical protein
MRFNWTIKELAPLTDDKVSATSHRINCLKMARACVIERKSGTTNIYSPLSKALKEVEKQLDKELDKLGSIDPSNKLLNS